MSKIDRQNPKGLPSGLPNRRSEETIRYGTKWELLLSFSSYKMDIRPKKADDQSWICDLLTERWGGTAVVAHGQVFEADKLPALVAGDGDGLATYQVSANGREAELVTLDAAVRGRGIGTLLVAALARLLRAQGVTILRLTTTNDNLTALRFYQRRGFRIVAIHAGAVVAARRLKPTIPRLGEHGIAIRDEIELELVLSGEGG